MIVHANLIIFGLVGCALLVSGEFREPSIWPQPQSCSTGAELTNVGKFKYSSTNGNVKTLDDAFERYNSIIFPHALNADDDDNSSRNSTPSVPVVEVTVTVEDNSEAHPQLETDESYTLAVPSETTNEDSSSESITITAQTIYGALRALETLSQLVQYDFEAGNYYIPATPININDAPRYPHRGMLLDTARHFQPVSFLKTTIDALSYAKYNVLHWHVVDTQSFPFESKAYPKLWEGAYSKQERYSHTDIAEIVEYGRARGVRVMIEFDMPGHAASWCAGYPEICPSAICQQPLDPSSNMTFPLITGLLSECTTPSQKTFGATGAEDSALFPYQLLHLGGDEVSYACWETNPKVQAWEQQQGLDGSEATYEYFVDKVAGITRDLGRTPVQWVEVFEHFGDQLDHNTVIHVWKEKSTMDAVLTAGYNSLLSNQDSWYLDHLDTTWDKMYANEPTEGLSDTSDPTLILGGESCMWGETVDPSDLMNTVWPRAAAVAEVLWTPYETIYPATASTNKAGKLSDELDWDIIEDRLETFRCLLTQRGVAAAPVTNVHARYEPKNPGSCYEQRRRL